ncbi:hypothetical protein DL98DRAFT_579371 [Cadophora sp. DSE1049]|nr:hypothetical protein DL98DRAFT_579371 [Cadophora sp. DSE1049]
MPSLYRNREIKNTPSWSFSKTFSTPCKLYVMSPTRPSNMSPSTPDILLPFCCPSNPIPQTSKPSKEISAFLAALPAIRDARSSTPKSPITATPTSPPASSSRSTSSTSLAASDSSKSTIKPNNNTPLFPPYPSSNPLPRTLILLQTTHPSPGPNQQRYFTQEYFAQLPGKDYWALQMWPQEGFGSICERRVEALWARGGVWVLRESLGEWGGGDGEGEVNVQERIGKEEGENGKVNEGDRKGWKCKCGREYWVRVVRFLEGERGWEDVERGGKSLGVSSWEVVD